jgi:hypothetical protein
VRLAFVIAVSLPLVAAACGDGQGRQPPADGETVRQIGGVAELATNAYASAGPEGLYDYLAPSVTGRCSKKGLEEALNGQDMPSGFRKIEDVAFEPDGSARAKVVQAFGDTERTIEWVFVRADGGGWRLTELPGLEECTS